jgi:C_GCAxxG_C_C family probable redox protein
MNLNDAIRKYRGPNYDLSCSEATIYAANETYQLGLDETALKMMAGFSGGLMREDLCGVIAGGVATLGVLFTDQVAHNSPQLKELVKEYLNCFDNYFDTINCKELKITHRDKINNSCNPVIYKNAEILESVIKKYYNQDK